MRTLVAVTGCNPVRLENLKQKALLFDRVADVSLPGHLLRLHRVEPDRGAELQWLTDQGIVYNPNPSAPGLGMAPPISDGQLEAIRDRLAPFEHEQLQEARRIYATASESAWGDLFSHPHHGQPFRPDPASEERFIKQTHLDTNPKYLRLMALRLRLLDGIDAVPMLDEHFFDRPSPTDSFFEPIGDGKNPLIQMVLKRLPVPDDSVAWERIIEFRNDPSAKDAWARLRDWMNELGRSSLQPRELEDKLEFLLGQFEQSMKLHEMKTTRRPFEAFVTASADFAESILKLRFSRAAEALFSARRRRLDLLQAERSSPGSAVGYIFKTRAAFGE